MHVPNADFTRYTFRIRHTLNPTYFCTSSFKHAPMTSGSDFAGSGGFVPSILPSPGPAPGPAPAPSISGPPCILPQARSTPLRPGSSRESNFIDYVDRQLLAISRRYEKRSNFNLEDSSDSDADGRGYRSFEEMAYELNAIIDVVWVSGTRKITIADKLYFKR